MMCSWEYGFFWVLLVPIVVALVFLGAGYVMGFMARRDREYPPPYLGPHCAECGDGFSHLEWDHRHTREDGEDVHGECCIATTCEFARSVK
jgi:hypothetical protein